MALIVIWQIIWRSRRQFPKQLHQSSFVNLGCRKIKHLDTFTDFFRRLLVGHGPSFESDNEFRVRGGWYNRLWVKSMMPTGALLSYFDVHILPVSDDEVLAVCDGYGKLPSLQIDSDDEVISSFQAGNYYRLVVFLRSANWTVVLRESLKIRAAGNYFYNREKNLLQAIIGTWIVFFVSQSRI